MSASTFIPASESIAIVPMIELMRDKYAIPTITLNRLYSDEELNDIAHSIATCESEWEKSIDFESYLQYRLQRKSEESSSSYSEESDEDDESDEYAELKRIKSEKEKKKFEDQAREDFNTLKLIWNFSIEYLYENESFKNFICTLISKNKLNVLSANNVILPAHLIESILDACMQLPPHSICIFFAEKQIISEPEALKIFQAIDRFRSITFSEAENSISLETATKLLHSQFNANLWVNGKGTYQTLHMRRWLIDQLDIDSIFLNGTPCSTEEIKALTTGLTNANKKVNFCIFKGNYTDPAWEIFFKDTLSSTTSINKINILSGINGDLQISNGVLSSIFEALKTNTTVTALDISYRILPEQALTLAEALMVNATLSQLSFSAIPNVKAVVEALIANPNSQMESLCFNHNYFGDSLGETFKTLLVQKNKLSMLLLGATGIANKTCQALSEALMSNTSLKTLSLFDNYFDDEGLLALGKSIMRNNTLSAIHMFNQHELFTPDGVQLFMEFCDQNKALLWVSMDMRTRELTKGFESLAVRNKEMLEYRKLESVNSYVDTAITLFRAFYQQQNNFSRLDIELVHNILSYLAPANKKTKEHNDLIAENALNKGWKTSKPITKMGIWGEETKVQTLFTHWKTLEEKVPSLANTYLNLLNSIGSR